jgi:hypothetical protein
MLPSVVAGGRGSGAEDTADAMAACIDEVVAGVGA